MKVGLIAHRYDRGGGSVMVARFLVEELRASGHSVFVVTAHESGPPRMEQRSGVKIYSFRPANLYWVGEKNEKSKPLRALWQALDTWNPQPRRAVARILRQEKPDLVHVHKLRGLSPSIWSAVSRTATPLVHTCHDYELISPQGTLEGRVGRWAERGAWPVQPYQRLRAASSGAVDVVTAPTAHVLDLHHERGFFAEAQRRVVPNTHGWSREELEAMPANPPGGRRIRVGYLGRLERSKGVLMLQEVFRRSAALRAGFELRVAGWGPNEPEVRALAGEVPEIDFVGAVEGEGKRRFLAGLDVLVLPSLLPESFGIVLVEAFAAGVPVIATRVGGIPDVVREGVNGVLVPPGDPAALEEALGDLQARPEVWREMGQSAFREAFSYTRESVFAAFEECYEIARRGRP